MRCFIGFCITAICLAAGSAYSQVPRPFSLNDVVAMVKGEKGESSQMMMDGMFRGAYDALIWANEKLRKQEQPGLFCQPDALALYPVNYRVIFLEEYARQQDFYRNNELARDYARKLGASIMTHLFADGLVRTFPCGK